MDSTLAKKYYIAGKTLFFSDKIIQSIQTFRRSRELDHNIRKSIFWEAIAMLRMVEDKKDNADKQADILSKTDGEVFYQMASILLKNHEELLARTWFGESLQHEWRFGISEEKRIVAITMTNDIDSAEKELKKALHENPDNFSLIKLKLHLLLQQNRTAEASVTIERYLASHPESISDVQSILYIMLEARLYTQAEKLIQKVEAEKDTKLYDQRRILYTALGKKQDALEMINILLTDTDNSVLRFEKGKLLACLPAKEHEASHWLAECIIKEKNEVRKREATIYLIYTQLKQGDALKANTLCSSLFTTKNKDVYFAVGLFLHPFIAYQINNMEKATQTLRNSESWLRLISGDPQIGIVAKLLRIILFDKTRQYTQRDRLLESICYKSTSYNDIALIANAMHKKDIDYTSGFIADIALPLWRDEIWPNI